MEKIIHLILEELRYKNYHSWLELKYLNSSKLNISGILTEPISHDILFLIAEELLDKNYYLWLEFCLSSKEGQRIYHRTIRLQKYQRFWYEKFKSLENIPYFETIRSFDSDRNYYDSFRQYVGNHLGLYEKSQRYLGKLAAFGDFPQIVEMVEGGVRVTSYILSQAAKSKNILTLDYLYQKSGEKNSQHFCRSISMAKDMNLINRYGFTQHITKLANNRSDVNPYSLFSDVINSDNIDLFNSLYDVVEDKSYPDQFRQECWSSICLSNSKNILFYLIEEELKKDLHINFEDILRNMFEYTTRDKVGAEMLNEFLEKYHDKINDAELRDIFFESLQRGSFFLYEKFKDEFQPLTIRHSLLYAGDLEFIKNNFSLNNFDFEDLIMAYQSGNQEIFDLVYNRLDIENMEDEYQTLHIYFDYSNMELFKKMISVPYVKDKCFLNQTSWVGEYEPLAALWMRDNITPIDSIDYKVWMIMNLPATEVVKLVETFDVPGVGSFTNPLDMKRSESAYYNIIKMTKKISKIYDIGVIIDPIEVIDLLIRGLKKKNPDILKHKISLNLLLWFDNAHLKLDEFFIEYLLEIDVYYHLHNVVRDRLKQSGNSEKINEMFRNYLARAEAVEREIYCEFYGFIFTLSELDRGLSYQKAAKNNGVFNMDVLTVMCQYYKISKSKNKKLTVDMLRQHMHLPPLN